MESWMCPRCGNRTQHYSLSREQYICDACGYAMQSESDRRKQEQYARSIAQAKKHLQVGNWDSCCSIIRPMLNEYPTDSLLYLLLLASLTRGYDDYLLDDMNRRMEAATVWDKLERLHSVNHMMRRYADSRTTLRHRMLSSRVSTAAALTAGIIVGFLISGAMSSGLAVIAVATFGFFAVKRMINKIKPISAMRELSRNDDPNPFR